MKPMSNIYFVTDTIKHDGKEYGKGDEIILSKEQAEAMLTAGVITSEPLDEGGEDDSKSGDDIKAPEEGQQSGAPREPHFETGQDQSGTGVDKSELSGTGTRENGEGGSTEGGTELKSGQHSEGTGADGEGAAPSPAANVPENTSAEGGEAGNQGQPEAQNESKNHQGSDDGNSSNADLGKDL